MKLVLSSCILFILFTSCESANTLFVNKELIQYEIKDENLINTIVEYQKTETKFNDIQGLVVLYSTDINNQQAPVYINHIYGDTTLYHDPISGYAIVNGKKILIYSRKERYMNPYSYTKDFSLDMKGRLLDDFSIYPTEDGYNLAFVDGVISNHSPPWKYKKGVVLKECATFKRSKVLYNKGKSYWGGYDYDGKGDSLAIEIGKLIPKTPRAVFYNEVLEDFYQSPEYLDVKSELIKISEPLIIQKTKFNLCLSKEGFKSEVLNKLLENCTECEKDSLCLDSNEDDISLFYMSKKMWEPTLELSFSIEKESYFAVKITHIDRSTIEWKDIVTVVYKRTSDGGFMRVSN